jgi:hypothetical protein
MARNHDPALCQHSAGPQIFVYIATKFKNVLQHESGALMGLFGEKIRGQKSRDTVPLSIFSE